jgi:hypothetical protein
MSTSTKEPKKKLTAAERLEKARRRANQSAAAVVNLEQRLQAQAEARHTRAVVLLGEWLEARLPADAELRKLVRGTLLPESPYDQQCWAEFWAASASDDASYFAPSDAASAKASMRPPGSAASSASRGPAQNRGVAADPAAVSQLRPASANSAGGDSAAAAAPR